MLEGDLFLLFILVARFSWKALPWCVARVELKELGPQRILSLSASSAGLT